jgi:hypothetical protein
VSKPPYNWRKTEKTPVAKPIIKKPPEVEEPMTKAPQASDPVAIEALTIQMAQLASMMAESQKAMTAQIVALGKQVAEDRREVRVEAIRPSRAPVRESGVTTAIGRDGEVVTRRAQFASSDPFELPPEFVEATLAEGYTLEWKTRLVYNEERGVYISRLQRDGGWRPVKNSRLLGVFSGEEEEAVQHDGMILMERRVELTNAARREEQISAREQLLMRQRNWGVDSKREDYFDPNTQEAQKHTLLRAQRERADPSWAPSHTIAGGDEFS